MVECPLKDDLSTDNTMFTKRVAFGFDGNGDGPVYGPEATWNEYPYSGCAFNHNGYHCGYNTLTGHDKIDISDFVDILVTDSFTHELITSSEWASGFTDYDNTNYKLALDI